MRTRTSRPCGFGVSTMVSHNGASNLTSDWRRISAMAFLLGTIFLRALRLGVSYIGQFTGHGNKAGYGNRFGPAGRVDFRGCGQAGPDAPKRLLGLSAH